MENPLIIKLAANDAFREIFQSMSEGIIIVNESGLIQVANPVAESMFGYGEHGLVGKTLEDLLPERYRKGHVKFRTAFNGHPEPRRMGLGRDLMALRKDGKEFPVEVSLSFTRVQNEVMFMGFISDISQRKKAEEALRQSEEQLIVYAAELERKVQARTEALNKMILELEIEVSERKKAEHEVRKSLERERELNELKTKFLSIASHEFRTPLSTILSSASLIEQYKKKEAYDKIDKHTQRIHSSVDHLTAILNDFLSLGKLEEGKVAIEYEALNLEDFFNEISEEVRLILKEGQELIVHCNASIKTLESDARILRNIFFNLLSNAIKYSEINKKIQLNCTNTDSHLIMAVQDEGMGIPEEEQKHLFERFFRATNVSNIQGTGLGLNIVKRYADLLDGNISFTSTYGKGSTFTVTIPLKGVEND